MLGTNNKKPESHAEAEEAYQESCREWKEFKRRNNISDEEENKPSEIALRSYARLKSIFNFFKRNKEVKAQQSEDENDPQKNKRATSSSSG